MSQTTQATAHDVQTWPKIPEAIWSPLAAGVIVLIAGLFAIVTGMPLLFVSLGPSAFLQAAQPQQPTAKFVNVLLGHLIGFALGAGAVLIVGAAGDPSVFDVKELPPGRLWASVIALPALLLIIAPTKVGFHPAAAATVLLVTLGGFEPSWSDAVTVAAGATVVAIVGEGIRRLRLAQLK